MSDEEYGRQLKEFLMMNKIDFKKVKMTATYFVSLRLKYMKGYF